MVIIKGKKFTTFRELHAKSMKDPAYKKAYDALEFEFALISAIIRARSEKGVTQKMLAEKMGTKQSSIARFESGTYNPTLAFIQKLVNALDIKIKVS